MMMRQSVWPKVKSLRIFAKLNRRAVAEINHGMEGSISFCQSRQLSVTFRAAISDAAKMIDALKANQTIAAARSGNAAKG
jgi:phage FluMu protein gp41